MRAIIFDMDGVLIDSEPIHQRIERALFAEYGLPVTREEHESYLGTSSWDMFATIAERHPVAWGAGGCSVSTLVDAERSRYQRALDAGEVPAIDATIDFARATHRAGLRVAIASSAPRRQIDLVVERAGLSPIVTCVRSADDVVHSKPDPEIYRSTAQCLGLEPAECWVVEDAAHGVAAARGAGMRCLGFLNPPGGITDATKRLGCEFESPSMPELAAYCLRSS